MASESVISTSLPIGGMHLACISHIGAENQVRSDIGLQEWNFDLTVTANVGVF